MVVGFNQFERDKLMNIYSSDSKSLHSQGIRKSLLRQGILDIKKKRGRIKVIEYTSVEKFFDSFIQLEAYLINRRRNKKCVKI